MSMGKIDGRTTLVGLMGWPVGHTVSPAIHNTAFAAVGLNWRYVPLPVCPERLREAVQGLRALGFAGCNVTVPHKQAVIACLDEVTDQARAIGAVNTIVVQSDGSLVGHNTDVAGFMRALTEGGFRAEGKRAVIMGAGGAARAVAYGLASAGAALVILNRTPVHTASLMADLAQQFPTLSLRPAPLTLASLKQETNRADLVVNATSMGMWPDVEGSPWPDALKMPSAVVVFDLVYNPLETKLMRQARAAGAQAMGGLEMLIYQGAAAWELWTAREAPVPVMAAAARAAFAPQEG